MIPIALTAEFALEAGMGDGWAPLSRESLRPLEQGKAAGHCLSPTERGHTRPARPGVITTIGVSTV